MRLSLARRKTLPRLHPLLERYLAVADTAANGDVRRAIAPHAGLGQPRKADLEAIGRFFWREEDERTRRLLVAGILGDRHWANPPIVFCRGVLQNFSDR